MAIRQIRARKQEIIVKSKISGISKESVCRVGDICKTRNNLIDIKLPKILHRWSIQKQKRNVKHQNKS